MKELIHIHIGQCGTQTGLNYWEGIAQEHGLDQTGTYNGDSDLRMKGMGVCFEEVIDKRYVPRAIFVDTDPASIDSVRGSQLGKLFRPEYLIAGKHGTGNNFAKARYTDGTEVSELLLEAINKEAEKCDTLQGFQITHAIGGGSGSGLGTQLFENLLDYFMDYNIQNFPVFPSPKVSDIVVEPYNVVFAMPDLYLKPSITAVIDNEALYDIALRNLISRTPTYNDMNEIIATSMIGATSCFRFPGQINSSLRSLSYNLVPFFRLHFCTIEHAPLSCIKTSSKISPSAELVQQLFNARNILCNIDPKQGRYFTAAANFRGKVCTGEIEEQLTNIQMQSDRFIRWIPDSLKISYCEVPSEDSDISATLIGNSTAVIEVFRQAMSRFQPMFRRKAFLHWYTAEGMDEMEIVEAESKFHDCICEYSMYQSDQNYGDFWNDEEEAEEVF